MLVVLTIYAMEALYDILIKHKRRMRASNQAATRERYGSMDWKILSIYKSYLRFSRTQETTWGEDFKWVEKYQICKEYSMMNKPGHCIAGFYRSFFLAILEWKGKEFVPGYEWIKPYLI